MSDCREVSRVPSSSYFRNVFNIFPARTSNIPSGYTNATNTLINRFHIPQILRHRRRTTTEENGKGRRFCLGGRIFQFLAALAVWPLTILKNRLNSSFSFKSSWCSSSYYSKSSFKTASAARNGIHSTPINKR